jgi:hypothetical protein
MRQRTGLCVKGRHAPGHEDAQGLLAGSGLKLVIQDGKIGDETSQENDGDSRMNYSN